MKNLIYLITVVFFVIALTSCDVVQTEKIRSYVIAYGNVDSISLLKTESGNLLLRISHTDDGVNWRSNGDDKVKYDNLCRSHNDMSCFRTLRFIEFPRSGYFMMEDAVAIEVTSNQDFDEKHPAGSSLNDVVRFCSATPAPYIQSGYELSYDWVNNYPQGYYKEKDLEDVSSNYQKELNDPSFDIKALYPIDDLLKDISSDQLELLGIGNGFHLGYLIFEAQPNTSTVHKLTVSMTTETEKTLNTSIEYSF